MNLPYYIVNLRTGENLVKGNKFSQSPLSIIRFESINDALDRFNYLTKRGCKLEIKQFIMSEDDAEKEYTKLKSL